MFYLSIPQLLKVIKINLNAMSIVGHISVLHVSFTSECTRLINENEWRLIFFFPICGENISIQVESLGVNLLKEIPNST